MKLYEAIAQNARCLTDAKFSDAAATRAKRIADCLPSGSGFDNGTHLVSADDSKIVLLTSFHHMNESGMYDGWTEHRVTVRASLTRGINIDVSGRNRNDIKTYISEAFETCLTESFDWIEVSNAQG